MTIAHDTTTTATAYTSTGTQTTSHGGSASTKAVVALIDQNGSTTDEVSGVTYGGTAMLRLDSQTEATEAGRVYIYYLLNPPTGTQNVAMTTTASTNKQLVCATMTGDPLNAIKVAGFGTGTSAASANPTWNITGLTASTKLEAYEVIHSGLQTMTNTPESPWTLISSTDLGSQGRGFARQSVASSGTTLSSGWTAGSDDYVGNSVAFWEDVNLVPDENSSFEGGTTGTWESNGIYTVGTLSNSATHADVGTKALLMTWPTTGSGSIADVDVLGLVDGQDYTLSGRIWVPSGHPDVRAEVIFFGAGSYVSTKGAFADASVTFTANSALHALCGFQVASATSGQQVWIDNVRVVAVINVDADASRTGTATGTATATVGKVGNAAATATGTLTATASVAAGGVTGDAALVGTGTLTATATVGKVGNATGAATGTLTATGTVGKVGASALAGTAAGAATAARGVSVDSTLAGTATATATGARGITGDASRSGTGTLTATGTRGVVAAAALVATATLTATATVGLGADASRTGTGTLASTATVGKVADASLAGTGTLTATASVSGADPTADAALAGTGTLTTTATVGRFGDASRTGTGTLAATATVGKVGNTSRTGTGTLTATATVGKLGDVTVTLTGTLSATATVGRHADADIAGIGTLTSTAAAGLPAYATIAATGTLTATASVASSAPFDPVEHPVAVITDNTFTSAITSGVPLAVITDTTHQATIARNHYTAAITTPTTEAEL